MAEKQTTEKQSTFKELVLPVIVLVVICLVCSALLAVLNDITAPIIAENTQAETLAALDLHQALTISSVSAWCVWLLFLLLAVRGMKKCSGKSHARGV